MGCQIVKTSGLKLKDAPRFKYLEALETFDIIEKGAILFRDGDKSITVIAGENWGWPDGLTDIFEDGTADLPVRILQPGDEVTLRITEND